MVGVVWSEKGCMQVSRHPVYSFKLEAFDVNFFLRAQPIETSVHSREETWGWLFLAPREKGKEPRRCIKRVDYVKFEDSE